MHFSVNDLDINFQLAVFAAVLEREPGLVGVREQESGRLLYINEAGIAMLGSRDHTVLEELLDRHQLGICGSFTESSVPPEERQWTNVAGNTFTGRYEVIPFRYAKKDYCAFRVASIIPNTRHQQQLNKELERFGALFDYASIGILVTNKEGEIVLINDFALGQFGYQRHELLGQKVEKLIPARSHHQHVGHRERFNAHPQNRPMGIGLDLFALRRDGSEFPVEISLSHYRNEEGTFVIAYVNNITERKKAEEKVEKLNNELEHKVEERTLQLRKALEDLEFSKEELTLALGKEKELNELKTRFVSMASHEFRTPLSTILSSAFLVKQYAAEADQPKRNKHIQRIVTSVNLLTDILNDFLSVGRIEEGKIQVRMSSFDITENINTVIQEMQGIIKDGQEISYFHTGKQEVLLDPSLLKHIVMNLLGNAIKFSPANATIAIYTKKEPGAFTLQVKDNGIGMSQEDQQHLFERFYRGANVSNIQGTGLGLHIVSKYSELMNGRISCESELGKGTTFTIVFSLNNK
ncbi:MAG TPA: PAS domain-containing sensor histidine kinase [Chitinophaga sp.]|uniref:sensor histidine kinase n=1 Tax=Chitinophaga sp. TaxID=1869181 RepID=UPI002DB7E9AE|nr:PAS domain-containing sensor histidine kinase [Chitinophaga sp.]HEU4554799.1 PAS domain-containing sensor histidine kinase [Chitinophaga sp.]